MCKWPLPTQRRLLSALAIGIWVMGTYDAHSLEIPAIAPPPAHLGPKELAVIINDLDPLSRKIGNYYQTQRHIPATNIIHLRFQPGKPNLTRAEFNQLKTEASRKTPSWIQAYALTWAAPYRVDCMSITTAFAVGFDPAFCSTSCGKTRLSPYFNSNSRTPYADFRIRPTMSLAAINFVEAKKLIDRGVASDHTFPRGTIYLVDTSDKARSVRAVLFPEIAKFFGKYIDIQIVKANYLMNRNNILFYFTGSVDVAQLQTNRFIPGAIADHLTSTGGQLTDSGQMSSLRWLEAGATGSYGTVTEPCNYLAKFPHPGIVIERYLRGETLIEAYWKSVAWPGEGIFIGEPLAKPFLERLHVH